MRRSVSRASKMSFDAQENVESAFPGIPEKKWQELLEKEETDLFLLGIREEIFTNCMKICYENYLEKQSVSFTVHCAYLAWLKVIDMYYMFRDPGDTDDPEVRKTWEPDEEPEPSITDSWVSKCIRIESRQTKDDARNEPKVETDLLSVSSSKYKFLPVTKPTSLVSEFFYGEEYDYNDQKSFTDSTLNPSSRKSTVFSRTLSMPRELLPMMTPMVLCKREKTEPNVKRKTLN